ncbi:dissimilatory-type sulfite reductase subunit alpha [Neomoorella thermoacetica]|nr:dissimilatory-type sulfite reductase subunit alpha [Moorella thermoacetica]AKX94393.1 sulfite reductase, dissimilatory-type subunit alpha [Moorella thermoacetica]AKX97029.1 sulfite reductase, dissimilatory-type subunit alpha [Moorella thermoacetica]OIQ54504.1 sulfite reductase, dissimilatory-type subunit alpha [Moorella thermoacetica]OIQ58200.1 sulfite reductase, dissimilatory-type subunit alpha [Moorella thermoacetica]QDA00859.1 Sulfite reductase, dissimilatory-type subunit alpha [Moorella
MEFKPKRPQKDLKYDELRIYTDEELHNYSEEELKNFKLKHDIPDLDELEKGPWPSFVADAKREALHRKKLADDRLMIDKDVVDDLLGQLQLSFDDGETHWKHGGIVGVFGYGGGVIGRYSDVPEKFPSVAQFHTLRVNQPASKFYKTDFLRALADLWEYRGSGMFNLHGSTGDIILLGTSTEQLEPIFYDLTHELDQDLGGSGSNLRTPSCCIGKARCEFACIDTQDLCYEITTHYQDELHRPAFPYKFKIKVDGCPNGCVASIARSDMSLIGTWRDDIRIDQEAVRAYMAGDIEPNGGAHKGRDWGKFDIQKEVIDLCPTGCMALEDGQLKINNKECNRCMHCINVMPRALKPGRDTGVSVLFGAKAPILEGAQLAVLTIPFMKAEAPYDNIKELVEKVWDWWMEEGKNRERLGELIQRKGLPKFLEVIGVPAAPQMVRHPRTNPYIFWKEEDVPGGWKRDINEYRQRHKR